MKKSYVAIRLRCVVDGPHFLIGNSSPASAGLFRLARQSRRNGRELAERVGLTPQDQLILKRIGQPSLR